eukprot:SAG25_NODE_948_length_4622_cov_14.307981_4_plen_96_part_00
MDEVLSTVHALKQADEDSSDDELPVGHLNEPRVKVTSTEIRERVKEMMQSDADAFKRKTLKEIRSDLQDKLQQHMGPFKTQIKKFVKDEVANLKA